MHITGPTTMFRSCEHKGDDITREKDLYSHQLPCLLTSVKYKPGSRSTQDFKTKLLGHSISVLSDVDY